MKFYMAFLCVLTLIVPSACTVGKSQQAAMKQGISGEVLYAGGNMMPGPGQKERPKGVVRVIRIYEVVKPGDAEGQAPLYTAVKRKLIAKVKSDSTGHYACRLNPGTYSVFTEEENGQLFSSVSNEKGELSTVQVLPNEVTVYPILVNYKAVY